MLLLLTYLLTPVNFVIIVSFYAKSKNTSLLMKFGTIWYNLTMLNKIIFSQLTTCYCFYLYKLSVEILFSKKESIDSRNIFYTICARRNLRAAWLVCI